MAIFKKILKKIFGGKENHQGKNYGQKEPVEYINFFDAVGASKKVPKKAHVSHYHHTSGGGIYEGAQFDPVGVLRVSMAQCANCGNIWWESSSKGGCPCCWNDYDIYTVIPAAY